MKRVEFRVKSIGIKPGDRAWASDEEAERLRVNGHAIVVGEKGDDEDEPAPPAKKAAAKKK